MKHAIFVEMWMINIATKVNYIYVYKQNTKNKTNLINIITNTLCASLQTLNPPPNGFANILFSNVQSVYDGNIADASWSNIYMICDILPAIMSTNNDFVVLKITSKQI